MSCPRNDRIDLVPETIKTTNAIHLSVKISAGNVNVDKAAIIRHVSTNGPDNITFVPSETTIHEFDSLTIICLANCYRSCSFQWIKHGDQDFPEMLIADSARMQILNITRNDAGNYSCVATNTVTNTTVVDSITLEVICTCIKLSNVATVSLNNIVTFSDGPDNMNFFGNETPIYEHGATTIACVIDCSIFCSFQWIKHGDHNISEMVVSDVAVLQIANTTRKDAGIYSCIATNTVTNKTVFDNITLEVIYGPNLVYFNEVKKENHSNIAQIKTVKCFADCYPPCEYSFIGPGVDIVNSKDYMYNVTDKGTYVCRAVNPNTGKASGAILLTISHETGQILNDSSWLDRGG
ncbi:hypothetical protein CHS0354_001312 [Potamilus streckersoni]|uniref:Ig-like domain-containing protein n=1 Tax=Potamilus streckersoni TaxID=2493646 RepID=A0AAE0RV47_9BIVA|nr:hypothetical protein CHS0354_001312 [Potamilus streckersoni]